MKDDTTVLHFPGSFRRSIKSFKDFKSAFLKRDIQAAGLQLYLIGFCDRMNARDLYPGGIETVDFQNVVSAIPNSLRGVGIFEITDAQNLIVDTGYDTLLRRDLSVEMREKEIEAHLAPMLSSIPVITMVQGELVRKSDTCLLFSFVRGLSRLQERLMDAARFEEAEDDLYRPILPRQTGKNGISIKPWTTRFQPVVNLEGDMDIVSYEVRTNWRQEVSEHSVTEATPEDTEGGEQLKLTLTTIQNALDALQFFKQADCPDIRMNIRVPYRFFSQGHLIKVLDKKLPGTSTSQLGVDFEITDIPRAPKLNPWINRQFDALNRYGCRLLLVDECGVNNTHVLLGALPVSGIRVDPFLICNLDNPAVRYMLAWFIEWCRTTYSVLLCGGVDSHQEFKTAGRLGANYMTGDYLGSPQKIERIIDDLKSGVEIELSQDQTRLVSPAS